jgi:chemotaxis methyl-accepting protein methylase
VHVFFRDLFDRAGVVFEAYRGSALSRRIPSCLRFLRAEDLHCARRKLRDRPDLAASALNVVLLGVTGFCRDEAVFRQLREEIVPALARENRSLRVWSAGCSDGRELYSAGILLHEARVLETASLLGTDCREEAIATAKAGRFGIGDLDKVEPGWGDCLTVDGDAILVSEQLRGAMRWKRADLLRQTEPGPWHLLFWRNMAIYLESAFAQQVWHTLFQELAPGGYLITGKADTPPRSLCLEKVGPCIYRKFTE